MGTASTPLVDALRQYRLLESDQLRELTRDLQTGFPDPKALARELLRRDWLTPYQARQLLQGRGKELRLGSYLLLDRLGEGGMGTVFKARNWKLRKLVALKVIRSERLPNPDALRRFHREVRAAARLNHPNVVVAYDADNVDGVQLLVMEYVDGMDLAKLIRDKGRTLPVDQACDYIRQSALGLQHAHEKGLVHRDIKPENLLLTADGTTVKILDMGLARVIQPGPTDGTCLTMTHYGAIIGTADYMAPEQSRQSHTVDIRADIYALGGTFYGLLTGQVPFPGGTFTEKLFKHQLEEPQPVEQLRPDVPPAVAQIVRKMMAKKPDDRYRTPGEVAVTLQSVLGTVRRSAPITARAAAMSDAGRPPSARRRWRRGALIGVVLLAAAMGAWAVVHRLRSPSATPAFAGGMQPALRLTGKPVDPDAKEQVAVLQDAQGQSLGAVYALTFSPDGRVLASGGVDKVIHLWDTRTGREASAPIRGHADDVRALAFTTDGTMLASGSVDRTVKLWDVATGRELASFSGHTGAVRSVAFTADGSTLASAADQDANVRLWDVRNRREQATWKGHEGGVDVVTYAADGQTLVSGGADRLIRFWDPATHQDRPLPRAHTSEIIALACSPDGKRLVSGTIGGLVRLWDLTTKENRKLKDTHGSITAAAFSPDSKRFAFADGRLTFADGRNRVVLWDVESGGALRTWPFPSPVHSLAFSPQGAYLVVGTAAGTINVLHLDPSATRPSK